VKSRAAILLETGGRWEIAEVDVAEMQAREVTVQIMACGLCHSEDHNVTGDFGGPLPTVGGHEGAGVVIDAGSEVTTTKVGNRVVLSPMIACGHCRWCGEGRSYLCDLNAYMMVGTRPDGSYRFRLDGQGLSAAGQIGAFSEYLTISEDQVINIDDDIPFEVAAVVGCGVPTGVGAAINSAGVKPGDVAVVVGVGGVGMNAVQGARIAGASQIIAVDPLEFRRTSALDFGATHTVASLADATDLVRDLTRGVMADKVMVTVGVLHGQLFDKINRITAKGGTVSITSVAPLTENSVQLPLTEFFLSNKSIVGNVLGMMNARSDFAKLFDQYRSGHLKLRELITSDYKLEEVNEGYADMHSGKNIRGVIRF
jgi:NDMA-dependent alcohol dehydrogenase